MAKETALNPLERTNHHPPKNGTPASQQLVERARADSAIVLQQLASQLSGLTAAVAASASEAVRVQ